jgi:hypothetical protein
MAVLDWALQHDFLVSRALRAWRVYMQHVDPATLGGNLSQIAVTVLVAANTDPGEVAAVLTYLLREKSTYLGRAVPELAFLPLEQPELAGVRGLLKLRVLIYGIFSRNKLCCCCRYDPGLLRSTC